MPDAAPTADSSPARDARLIELLEERALKRGDFTLASGQKSSYYLDGKQITLHAEGLSRVAAGILDLLDSFGPVDAVGGMSLGADPIVGGVLAAASESRPDLVGFLVRKQSKDHGTQKFIEGPLAEGHRCVIVEDVVTTGGSSLLAIERVEAFGATVVGVVTIVDRLQGGTEAFADAGYPLRSLATIRDFGIEPPAAS